jgi:hypothetical protein
MTEPTAMVAPLVMMVPETMAATATATMMMAAATIDFQAPTDGSVSVDVSSR